MGVIEYILLSVFFGLVGAYLGALNFKEPSYSKDGAVSVRSQIVMTTMIGLLFWPMFVPIIGFLLMVWVIGFICSFMVDAVVLIMRRVIRNQ